MLLSKLVKSFATLPENNDPHVSGLTLDSRQVQPGYVFCALIGSKANGESYIESACKSGAVAILIDSDSTFSQSEVCNVPVLRIPNLQRVVGEIAANYFSRPSEQLRVFGVTGTNGKTSCTHFAAQILSRLGHPCGVIGTLGSGLMADGAGSLSEFGLTTPDAISLQQQLHQFVELDAAAATLEVSSHSIDQWRISGIQFDVGIFTNLSQDHLDYHQTMANYAAVKKSFFEVFPVRHKVINSDDVYGAEWLSEFAGSDTSLVAYTVTNNAFSSNVPTVRLAKSQQCQDGMALQIITPWGNGEVLLPLIGQFNVSNALAVIAALGVSGFSLDEILREVANLTPVPGRLELVPDPVGKRHIVVDYAHTPDALEKALLALRPHTSGKLWCVFGCGGDRDVEKRPLMAAVAEKYADMVVVTSDNPRHEAPSAIIEQILTGFADSSKVKVESDRSKAIHNSIQWALHGDCVLIAGKGAERYQQIGDDKLPFSDVKEVERVLSKQLAMI